MDEIKLIKRMKYAGDVYNALVTKAGFYPDEAAAFLNEIPDVPRGTWKRTPISGTLFCPFCDKIPDQQVETAHCPSCDALLDV